MDNETKQKEKEARKRKRRKERKETFQRQKTVWQRLVDSERHMAAVLCYCGIFMLYGMTDEVLGPTLIELSCLAKKNLKTMSWLFFSHDLGLLVGTLIGGFLAARSDANLLMSLCLVGNALSISFIPVLHKFSGMLFFVLMYGVFLGTPDTLTNVMLVKIFGKEVPPYMQGVHFFYGFGAFISPLIARPFLRPDCKYDINTTHYVQYPNSTLNSSFDNSSGYWVYSTIETVQDTTSDIRYAYWVISISHIPVVFGLSWLYFRKRLEYTQGTYRGSIINLATTEAAASDKPGATLDLLPYDPEATFWEKVRKNEKSRLFAVTSLCSLIIYLYEGLMAVFGGYIYSYAVKGNVAMTSDDGAYLTSFYWGFFSVGRFLCIPIAFFITPKTMLTGNVVGCFVAAFIIAAGNSDYNAIWVGTCGLGLFLSSTGPTIIAMAEQYVELTAHSTSTLVVMSALGELTMPVIVGQMFERLGPGVVPAWTFLICLVGFVVFCFLLTFDNDVAYEHANSLWIYFRAIWCCSDTRESREAYGSMDSSSDYPSSSESPVDENGIPRPDVFTDSVQPEDEELVIGKSGLMEEIRRAESEPLLPKDNYNNNMKH